MSTAATPNWLSSETSGGATAAASEGLEPATAAAPAPATDSATTSAVSAAGAGATAPAAAAAAEADDAELPGVILTMRLANMGVAVALIAIAVRYTKRRREEKKDLHVNHACFVQPDLFTRAKVFFLAFSHAFFTVAFFSLSLYIYILLDYKNDWPAFHFGLCLVHLCLLRRLVDLLSGNTIEILARHDCRQFWLFVQFLLAIRLLRAIGEHCVEL
jgi:hypothetical protein